MAAGLGFKDFTTGEVLTAADVDGYLMQGVWVFASAAARDAAVTSPQEGNFAYLKDTNVTTYYTGSAWANLDTTGMTNPMTTTGDIIYSSSGSTPARLGIGSTGNVLTVAGGVPSWAAPAGGAMTVLASGSLSGSQLDLTSISANYNDLQLVIRNSESGSNVGYELRVNNITSGTYNRGMASFFNTTFATSVSNTDTAFQLTYQPSRANEGSTIIINLPDYANTTSEKLIDSDTYLMDNVSGIYDRMHNFGGVRTTAAIDRITFIPTSNFTAGTYILYGIK